MPRVLGREAVLFPGAEPGASLRPRSEFADQTFIAPEPADPLPVQCHQAVRAGLGQRAFLECKRQL